MKGISFKEFMVHIIAQSFLCGIFLLILYINSINFMEIWNGKIVKKYSERVSCEHSYRCHCYTSCSGSGSKRSCTEHCSTCYDHSYDVDWVAEDNTFEKVRIHRVDRQGLREPERFSKIEIGEATSHSHTYRNYLKASKTSIYNEKYKNSFKPEDMPKYPNNIFDYYKLDRLIDSDYTVDVKYHWQFMQMNGDFGKYECNAILILTKNKPQEYAEAVSTFWGGGNKNDAILIINMNDLDEITWVQVYSLTENSLFQVSLRDDILLLKKFDIDKILDKFSSNIKNHYKRMEMKNFEYLKYNLSPSMLEIIILMILGIATSIGLAIFFNINNTFGDE